MLLQMFFGLHKKFQESLDGNVALFSAIFAPLLLGTAAVGIDYTIFNNQRSALQQAADVAALASVKELGLSGSNRNVVEQVGISYAQAAFQPGDQVSGGAGTFLVDVQPQMDERQVTVNLSYEWSPFFAHLLDQRVTPIRVTSSARLAGKSLTCVIGLMQPQRLAKSSIHLDDKAVVEADNCAVYSNSTSRYGLRADSVSSMTASTICSAGGVLEFGFGRSANFQPKPITDCPKIEDPLSSRNPPAYGSCDFTNLKVSTSQTLKPGVYCGGLEVSGSPEIKLNPGVYVIKDGPLIVRDRASFFGADVTFFLTGDGSIFEFQSDTSIDLSASETGSTAGLLFYEDRNVNYSFDFNPFLLRYLPSDVRMHKISSNDARNLLGTLYLSRSILLIDAEAPVADSSAYTAIITGRLWLREGPTLTLNADLTDTKVPVPDGLVGTEPVLSK
ncbi:MAG: TadE/TadG family type IV pilus assembly protein [Pseudomonadota bacterium]